MQPLVGQRNVAVLAIFAACAAVFLTALDQTVVVTALPQIITDLHIPPTNLDHAAWIVSGYLLGYVIVMPLMGRVSDFYGRRQVFVISLVVFALGSLGCALAPLMGDMFNLDFVRLIGVDTTYPGLIWLVAARFVQAAGGGAVVPVAMAIAGDFYGAQRRGIVLGLIGMVTEAGGVLGPLYGSLIVQAWQWPAIFYLNIPLVAILLLLIFRFVPGRAHQPLAPQTTGRIDFVGALLLGASLLCLSLGLAQEAAQITPATLTPEITTTSSQNNPLLIAVALALFVAFVICEIINAHKGSWPLLDLALFKHIRFSAATMTGFLLGAALIIAMVDIPIFFLTVFNSNSLDSGLALLRLTVMIPVGALLGGWLCQRITCRWTAVLGLFPAIFGFWLMHLWSTNIDWTLITESTLLSGLGLGLVIAPISTTTINAATQHQLGMASSVVTVSRMIGMILGLAALTSWGLGRFRALVATFHPPAGVTPLSTTYNALYFQFITTSAHQVYTAIFLAAGILCAIALLPALFLEGRKSQTQSKPAINNLNIHVPTHQANSQVRQESEASSFYEQKEQ